MTSPALRRARLASWPAAVGVVGVVMYLADRSGWSERTTYLILIGTLICFVAVALPMLEPPASRGAPPPPSRGQQSPPLFRTGERFPLRESEPVPPEPVPPVPESSRPSAGAYKCANCGYELDVSGGLSSKNLPPCPSCGQGKYDVPTTGRGGERQYRRKRYTRPR